MDVIDLLSKINWGVIAPLIVIQFILLIVAAIDLIRAEKTNGPKWMWILVIILINFVGPVLYFIFGRRND